MKSQTTLNAQSTFVCNNNSRSSSPCKMLHRLCLLLILATMVSANAADYVLVVDTSGSMRDPVSDRDKRIRITVVQKALREYLPALPQPSRVYLIAFNTGIVSEREMTVKDSASLQKALAWVDDLDRLSRGNGQTYLWTTLRRALEVATRYSAENHDQPVIVRVLTDGEDNQRVTSLEKVLRQFPLVDGEHIRGNLVLLGDLELKTKLSLPEGAFTTTTSTTWTDIFPPVVVCIPSDPRTGDEVRFVENTRSIYADYEWLVDGRTLGREKILSHRFPGAGIHRVTLKVKGLQGNADSTTVFVNVQPKEKFTAELHTSGAATVSPGDSVRFWAQPNAPATRFAWYADDQSIGSSGELNHRFDTEGTFEIKSVVWSTDGAATTNTRTIVVKEPALTALIKGPDQATAGESVQFASEITGPCARVQWRFGDSKTSSDPNPTHAFGLAGQPSKDYPVWLRVESPMGHVVEVGPHVVRVQERQQVKAPVASFRQIEQSVRVGDTLHLVDESRGYIESWEWRVGDALVASDKNPVIQFSKPGPTRVSLIVRGPGGTNEAVRQVEVSPRFAPVRVLVAASCVSGIAPLTVQFTNLSTGDVHAWLWEFGDGQTSTNANPRHAFVNATNYSVAVTAFPLQTDQKPLEAHLTINTVKPWPVWGKAMLFVGCIGLLTGAAWLLARHRQKLALKLIIYFWPEDSSVCRSAVLTLMDETRELMPDAPVRIKRIGKSKFLVVEPVSGSVLISPNGEELAAQNVGLGARIVVRNGNGSTRAIAISALQKPRRPSPVPSVSDPFTDKAETDRTAQDNHHIWEWETNEPLKTN
jgi:PKD repeat protein